MATKWVSKGDPIEMIRNCTRISRTLDRVLEDFEHEHTNRFAHKHKATGPVEEAPEHMTPSPETSF